MSKPVEDNNVEVALFLAFIGVFHLFTVPELRQYRDRLGGALGGTRWIVVAVVVLSLLKGRRN